MSIQAINVRNQFKGKVKEIIRGDVVSEVDVETPWGIVTSVITTRSVDDLELKAGVRGRGAGQVHRSLDRQALSIWSVRGERPRHLPAAPTVPTSSSSRAASSRNGGAGWESINCSCVPPCCTPARRQPSPSRRCEPFLHVRHFLRLLGFRDCGRPLIFHDGPGCRTLAQGMELDLAAARAVAAPHMATLRSRLQSKHIEVAFGDQATSAALA